MFISTQYHGMVNILNVRAFSGVQSEDGKYLCLASLSEKNMGPLQDFDTGDELNSYMNQLLTQFQFFKPSPSGVVFNVCLALRLSVVPSEAVASDSVANFKEFLACVFFSDVHTEILGTGTQEECSQIIIDIFAPKPTILKPIFS